MLKQQLLGLGATMKTKLSRLNKIKLISSLQVKIKLTSKFLSLGKNLQKTMTLKYPLKWLTDSKLELVWLPTNSKRHS